jgi:hypothetical protein
MRFMCLIIFSDFMQVLLTKGWHPTNNEYFLMHILFFSFIVFFIYFRSLYEFLKL